MTSPRERRPRPDPVSPEDQALIEAKYLELDARLEIYAARVAGRPFSLIMPQPPSLADV